VNVSRGIWIGDSSRVAEARRISLDLARQMGFADHAAGNVALVVTEAATNLVKHSSGGHIVLRRFVEGGASGVEMLALDKGPGIPDLQRAMRDGYSTAGSPGTGLGAISRLSSEYDVYSAPGLGTALMARFHSAKPLPPAIHLPVQIGSVCLAKQGELASGDLWAARADGEIITVLVVDGLGHGQLARDAALAAVAIFEAVAPASPRDLLEAVHRGMAATRGGAVAIAALEPARQSARFSGVGNISAVVANHQGHRNLVSHNGTVGQNLTRVDEYAYPFPTDAVLIMHSDGLSSRWQMDAYPGLIQRHPSLIAGILFRDFCRGRDDSVVVAVRGI
jgi:anti-sigma regulatory factor (Ser/Thr protein kinase)